MVTRQTCADSARQTFQLLLRLQKTISESPALPSLAPPTISHAETQWGWGGRGGNPLTFLNDVLSPACTVVAGFPLGWLFPAFLHQQAMPPWLASPPMLQRCRGMTQPPLGASQELSMSPSRVPTRDGWLWLFSNM